MEKVLRSTPLFLRLRQENQNIIPESLSLKHPRIETRWGPSLREAVCYECYEYNIDVCILTSVHAVGRESFSSFGSFSSKNETASFPVVFLELILKRKMPNK